METCWNCKKQMTAVDEALVPLLVKLGVRATMLLVAQDFFYPNHVCRRCRTSTAMIGALGLILFGSGIGYGILVLARYL